MLSRPLGAEGHKTAQFKVLKGHDFSRAAKGHEELGFSR
jgi:hypothetical protein